MALMRRLRDEFTAMPGLRLTEAQVQRLCDVNALKSASALRALVSAAFLRPLEDGSYRRADLPSDFGSHPSSDAKQAPWRRILCLIEFEDESGNSLTAASYSILARLLAKSTWARFTPGARRSLASTPAAQPPQPMPPTLKVT